MRIVKGLARALLIGVCLLQIQCDVEIQRKPTSEMEPFYGNYEGTTINVAKGEVSERDLGVAIKPWGKEGFTIEWSAVIYRSSGNKKRSEASINFYASMRPAIYASAMRTNVFGNVVPYDPVGENADPYVWAGLEGDTLTVNALYIVDGSGYEMHIYKRSLHKDGLELNFTRLRDSEVITEITALLRPIEP